MRKRALWLSRELVAFERASELHSPYHVIIARMRYTRDSPLIGSLQVSWHFRGPTNLKQFAAYTPGGASSKKRSEHVRRHAHGAAHGHAKHAQEKRDVGDMVYATMNGDVVSWINGYAGGVALPSEPAASSYGGSSAPASSVSAMPSAVSSAPSLHSSAASSSDTSGGWGRNGYYSAEGKTAEGIVFLNHFGGQGSGTFDYTFGNSLSYASCDGISGSANKQVLEDTTLPSSAEVIIMTDKKCEGDSCGYYRPGTVAYEGFDGSQKAFFFEFSMPDSGEGTTDIYDPVNMPAIWMLNAQIPRTLQYGNPDCSCWETGCGEFDMFEVLAPGDNRAKSTLHGNKAGGSSDYFSRPVSSTIKVGMVLYDDNIHIKVLNDSIDFPTTMDESTINDILGSTSQQSPKVAMFNLADATSG